MRTFEQLTDEEQQLAVQFELEQLLKEIIECGIRFNDALNHDDLQARIDAACTKAEEMRTPWFAHEYILDTCREELEGMARAAAEDSLYPDPDERVSRANLKPEVKQAPKA